MERTLQLLYRDYTDLFSRKIINKDGIKQSVRKETWGKILYNFKTDLFSAETIFHTTEIIPEAPLGIYWLVTAPCNFKCVHCYGNVEELPRVKQGIESQRLIEDRIIESEAMRVTLSGGEALLRSDTPEMIERLVDHEIWVVLGTNGTYLKPSIMKSIARANRVEI